jgi:hypothetical protein
MVDSSFVFSLVAAIIAVGGILVVVGVYKGKVQQAAEINAAQGKQIEDRATRAELSTATARAEEQLATAIKRSDDMLDLMRKRAEEDRASGEGHYRELYGIITSHGERIKAVETAQKAIDKSLEEIKSDIKTGFAEVKTEIRELRSQG